MGYRGVAAFFGSKQDGGALEAKGGSSLGAVLLLSPSEISWGFTGTEDDSTPGWFGCDM